MTRQLAPILTALLLATATGCDGENKQTTPPPQTSSSSTTAVAELKQAVRSAIMDNRRLSKYVLTHNTIPAWATRSTRGPALSGLRTAAADRRSRGIRVRLLSDRFRILSIRLDPSYTNATALVRATQRVRPSRRDRKAMGRAVELNEKARIELRRVERANRFVVWRVQIAP